SSPDRARLMSVRRLLPLLQVGALAAAAAVAVPPLKDGWERRALDRKETRIWRGEKMLPAPLEPAAWLRIPSLSMERLVVRGAREADLKTHLACLKDEAQPDSSLLIFGHRDLHFRPLKDLREGESVHLQPAAGQEEWIYRIVHREVVEKVNLARAIDRGQSRDKIALITCHPFYFVGDAPERFIAWAERTEEEVTCNSTDTGENTGLILAGCSTAW
ncbi:MAG: sortase, partial [Verrucomicrobiota bacterium]